MEGRSSWPLLVLGTGIAVLFVMKRTPPAPVGSGVVHVVTTPVSAPFQIDGGEWVNAPATVTLSAGVHEIVFADVSDLISPDPLSFTVTAGEEVTITGEYEQGYTSIVIRTTGVATDGVSIFPGASVMVDGVMVNSQLPPGIPLELRVAPGSSHTVEFGDYDIGDGVIWTKEISGTPTPVLIAGQSVSVTCTYTQPRPIYPPAYIAVHATGIPVAGFRAAGIVYARVGEDSVYAGPAYPGIPLIIEVESHYAYGMGFQGYSETGEAPYWFTNFVPYNQISPDVSPGCYTPILAEGETWHCWVTYVQGALYPMWDLNQDGIVDDLDQAIFAAAYGSTPADAKWNRMCDFCDDGLVGEDDLAIFEQHFGESY